MITTFLISDLDNDAGAFQLGGLPPPGEFVNHGRTEQRSKAEGLDRELMHIGVTNLHRCQMVKKRQAAQRAKALSHLSFPLVPPFLEEKREEERRRDIYR